MLIIVIHYHYNNSKAKGSKGFFLFFLHDFYLMIK